MKINIFSGSNGLVATSLVNTDKLAAVLRQIFGSQHDPHVTRPLGEMDGIKILKQRDGIFAGSLG